MEESRLLSSAASSILGNCTGRVLIIWLKIVIGGRGRHEWYSSKFKVPGTSQTNVWLPMGTAYRPEKIFWVPMCTGYRPKFQRCRPLIGGSFLDNIWFPYKSARRDRISGPGPPRLHPFASVSLVPRWEASRTQNLSLKGYQNFSTPKIKENIINFISYEINISNLVKSFPFRVFLVTYLQAVEERFKKSIPFNTDAFPWKTGN